MSWIRFWLVFAWVLSIAGTVRNTPSDGLMFSTVNVLICAAWCFVNEVDRRLPAAPAPKEPPDADPEFESVVDAVWGPARKGRRL